MNATDWLTLIATVGTIYWTCHGLGFMKSTAMKVIEANWMVVFGVVIAIWVSWFGVFRLILGEDNGSGKRLAKVNELFKQDKLALKRQK